MVKKSEPVLEGFMEGPLNFPPTYKFDVETHTYDTSAKKRKPTWTDRILWVSAGRAPPYRPITLHYSSHMGFTLSDHKPVSALFCLHFPFKVNVPLVTLEVEKEWTKFSDATVKLTVAHGFQRSSWEWVGLYKVQLPMSTLPAPACRSHSDSSDVSFEDDSTLVLLAPSSRRTSPGNHSSKQHHQKRQRSRSPAVPALSGMPLLSLQSLSLCPRPRDGHPHSSSRTLRPIARKSIWFLQTR